MSIGPESPKMTQLLDQSNGLAIAITASYFRIYAMVRLAQIAAILDHWTGAVIGRDSAAGLSRNHLKCQNSQRVERIRRIAGRSRDCAAGCGTIAVVGQHSPTA